MAADLSINDLAVIAKSNSEQLKRIDITFEMTQESTDGKGDGRLLPLSKERWLFDLALGHYKRISDWSYLDKSNSKSQASFNGKDSVLLLDEGRSAIIQPGTTAPDDPAAKIQLLSYGLMYPPKPNGFGLDDFSLQSLLKHGTLRKEKEAIDGVLCYVVDAEINDAPGTARRYATVWIDSDRGAVPLRVVDYRTDGNIRGDSRIERIHEFHGSDGHAVWLPVSILVTTSVMGHEYKIKVTADINQTTINTPLDYGISFPPGCHVMDNSTGTTFIVPGERVVRAEPRQLQGSSRWRLIGLNLLAIAALIVAIIYRRHSRRREYGDIA